MAELFEAAKSLGVEFTDLNSVDLDEIELPSLDELFKLADEIGSKYQAES